MFFCEYFYEAPNIKQTFYAGTIFIVAFWMSMKAKGMANMCNGYGNFKEEEGGIRDEIADVDDSTGHFC